MESELTPAEVEQLREEARAALERARAEFERVEGLLMWARRVEASTPERIEERVGVPQLA